MNCPCKSGLDYQNCCKPYHDGEKFPKSPEILMRSRFSAYALGLIDYIIATTDPKGPQYESNREKWIASIQAFCQMTNFVFLEILDQEMISENQGTVTFYATLQSFLGEDISFQEKSLFFKRNGKWFYHSKIG